LDKEHVKVSADTIKVDVKNTADKARSVGDVNKGRDVAEGVAKGAKDEITDRTGRSR
jgi:hypothetical protein